MWSTIGFSLLNFILFCAICYGEPTDTPPTILEGRKESENEILQRTDSLSLLIQISLLIMTVLVVWMFKIHRFRCFHETGIAMIFGIAVGAMIKYCQPTVVKPAGIKVNNCGNLTLAPKLLWVNINGTEYSYTLNGIVFHKHQDDEGSELEHKSSFNPEVFFHVLLPPIIFFAGYNMQKRYFFRNLGAIVTYSFFGTTISCIVTGSMVYWFNKWTGVTSDFDYAECLLFGALISATDPVTVLAIFHDLHVDVDVYALVFGESVFNDAVAIVLYRAIENYLAYHPTHMRKFDILSCLWALGNFVTIFFGSCIIGCGMGCINALVTKLTKIGSFPILETALFFLMSYGTFLAADVANWSGIVAVLFCGITQQHYTYKNLSEESRLRTYHTFELLNFLAENFIFSYIGLSVFAFTYHQWNFAFIGWTFLAIQVGRFLNIYPLSFCLNLARSRRISANFQHMMFFSGLRGAIAFALAVRNTVSIPRQMMLTSTLMIVLTSVIVFGGLTSPALRCLKIKTGVDEIEEEEKARRLSLIDLSDIASEEEKLEKKQYEKAWMVRLWEKFDDRYLAPVFTEPCFKIDNQSTQR